jgi:hypothetical protein
MGNMIKAAKKVGATFAELWVGQASRRLAATLVPLINYTWVNRPLFNSRMTPGRKSRML